MKHDPAPCGGSAKTTTRPSPDSIPRPVVAGLWLTGCLALLGLAPAATAQDFGSRPPSPGVAVPSPLAPSEFAQDDRLADYNLADGEFRPGGSRGVLFSFPRDVEQLSVGRSGELTLALEIPMFAAVLQPTLRAVYSSRAGEGVMGVGWDVPIPSVDLDLADGREALDLGPEAFERVVDGSRILEGRWTSTEAGDLLCEPPPDQSGASWRSFRCFSNPRSELRFEPIADPGDARATSFRSVDPATGIIREYGTSAATRILDPDGRIVSYLLARELSRWGEEVVYFYEERADSDERLLKAVLVDGNKTVQFVYDVRQRVRELYRHGVRRTREALLQDIALIVPCTPTQVEAAPDDVWVRFDGCIEGAGETVERVELKYRDPDERFTGRPALASWQHMSGDRTVQYAPVEFDYVGDDLTVVNGTIADLQIDEVPFPSFELPEGFPLFTGSAAGPIQTYRDVNRDGVPDLLHTRSETGDPWPDPYSGDHRLHLIPGADYGWASERSYAEPLVEHAVALTDDQLPDRQPFIAHGRDQLTDDVTNSFSNQVDPGDVLDEAIDRGWREDVTIGLDLFPLLYMPPGEDEQGAPPIFESLSHTVPCARLGVATCTALRFAYNCSWNGLCEPTLAALSLPAYHDLGIKVTDLADMNGDGYLDRVVSGLLVIWERDNPNRWRSPIQDDPAVWVSFFDPDADDFRPFVRYEIPGAMGDSTDLPNVLVQALGVELTDNQDPSVGDLSGMVTAAAIMEVTGALSKGWSTVQLAANASHQTPSSVALSAVTLAASAVDQATRAAGVRPEVRQAMTQAATSLGMLQMATGLAESVRLISNSDAVLEAAAALGHADGSAVRGAAGANIATVAIFVANMAVTEGLQGMQERRLGQEGKNSLAVAANAKITNSVVQATFTAVSTVLGAYASLAAGSAVLGPGGAVVSIVGGVVTLVYLAAVAFGAEGSIVTRDGEVKYDVFQRRGIKYRASGTADHSSGTETLLTWADLTGDGRPDLVTSSVGTDDAFAVAAGAPDEGFGPRTTREWRRWEFEDGDGISKLGATSTHTSFELDHVHRADQTDSVVGLVDINGDGLADLVETATPRAAYGPWVWVNTGAGFAAGREWVFEDGGASAPSGCRAPATTRLSRSRSISWTESVSSEEGFSVGLSNLTSLLGPDLDGNGLPDLVIKDELDIAGLAPTEPCSRVFNSSLFTALICDDPLPVKAETPPDNNNNTCDEQPDASNVWFANFDGQNVTTGTGEGYSHLTEVALDLYSPQYRGKYWVAFNTGEGFTRYYLIEEALPSIGGGLSVLDVTNSGGLVPNAAIAGTSNLMATSVDGRLTLRALDVEDDDIFDPSSESEVSVELKMGVANADALVAIHYPEGGTARIDYRRQIDLLGRQGGPLWVVSRTEFDDVVGAQTGLVEPPSVEYGYRDGLLEGREFVGFGLITESRFRGDAVIQVLHRFEQDGPARGFPICTEIRGDVVYDKELDDHRSACGITESGAPDYLIRHSRDQAPIQLEGNPEAITTHCVDDPGDAGLSLFYPAQKVIRYDWSTGNTLFDPQNLDHQGDEEEVWRDVLIARRTDELFNGDGQRSTSTVTAFQYDPAPYRTVRRQTLTTHDGLRRSADIDWEHHEEDWVFLQRQRTLFEADGSTPRLTTSLSHQPDFPFELVEVRESSPSGERWQRYDAYDRRGLPLTISDEQGSTHYRYHPAGANGSGRLQTVERPTDSSRPRGGLETYAWDARGRLLRFENPAGEAWVYRHDALGVLAWEQRPGESPRRYSYHHVGDPSVFRGDGDLGKAQRTVRAQAMGDDQDRLEVTYWDGFYRAFRDAVAVLGERSLAADFNGDGSADHTLPTVGDRDWFVDRAKLYLLQDTRLDGAGEAQCHSLPYVEETRPAGWSTTLRDALGRPAALADAEGGRTYILRSIDPASGSLASTVQREELLEPAGMRSVLRRDALGRLISENRARLEATSYRYDLWDHLVEVEDGRGYLRRREVDAWGLVARECVEVADDPNPPPEGCPEKPESWLTSTLERDFRGRVVAATDPAGATTRWDYGVCGAHAIELPGGSNLERRFDEVCRASEQRERNGARTLTRFDGGGRPVEVTRAAGTPAETSTTYGWDALGRPEWVGDGAGHRRYVSHDFRDRPSHLLEATWVPAYGVWQVQHRQRAYGTEGFLEKETDARGHEVDHENDRMGRRTQTSFEEDVCDPGATLAGIFNTVEIGLVVDRKYDRAGRLVREQRTDGSAVEFEYDAAGRLTRSIQPHLVNQGAIDPTVFWDYEYDRAGHPVLETSPEGRETAYHYDGAGRLVRIAALEGTGQGFGRSFQYDGAGRLAAERPFLEDLGCIDADPGDLGTELTYEPTGELATLTHPADADGRRAVERFLRDPAGRATAHVDALGHTTGMVHDELDRLVQVRHPDGATESWSWDTRNLLTEHVGERGSVTRFVHDDLGRLRQQIAPSGLETRWGYGLHNQVVFAMDRLRSGEWRGTATEYTVGGRPAATSLASYSGAAPPLNLAAIDFASRQQLCYDPGLRASALADPLGAVTLHRFDARGRMREIWPARLAGGLAVPDTFDFDDDGLLLRHTANVGSATGPATVSTSRRYDGAGRLSGERTSLRDASAVFRYAGENLCRVEEATSSADRRSVELRYDARGLVQRRRSSDSSLNAELGWDPAGNLVAARDGTGLWTYEYDRRDRPTAVEHAPAGTGLRLRTTYAYTPDGLLRELRLPTVPGFGDGPVMTVDWDPSAPLVRSVTVDGEPLLTRTRYDGLDRLVGYRLGEEVGVRRAFDRWGRLSTFTSQGQDPLLDWKYRHDDAGNLVARGDGLNPLGAREFTYDERQRLVRAVGAGFDASVELNDLDQPERIDRTGGGPDLAFTYDGQGRVEEISSPAGVRSSYTYDAFGNRASDGTAAYRWDGLDRLVGFDDGTASLRQTYSHEGRRIRSGGTLYAYGNQRLPLAEIELDRGGPESVRYNLLDVVNVLGGGEQVFGLIPRGLPGTDRSLFLNDRQGTPVIELAWDGSLVAQQETSPWGGQVGSGGLGTSIGFQSNPFVAGTGLVNMHHRVYDPFSHSFLSLDPAAPAGPGKLHAFASANPANLVDRWGLEPERVFENRFTDKNELVIEWSWAPPPPSLADHAGAWAQKFHDRAFESAVHFVMMPWYVTFGAIDIVTDPVGTVQRRVENLQTTYQRGSEFCGGGLLGAGCGASSLMPGGSLRQAALETGYEIYQGDVEKLRDRSAVVAADVAFAAFTGAAGRAGAASSLGRGNLGSSLSRGMARPKPGTGVRAAVQREVRDGPGKPPIPCANSFPAGTGVRVPGPSGAMTLPIDELRVGDAVLARQEHGDEVGEQRVSGTYSRRVPRIVRLTLASLPAGAGQGRAVPAGGSEAHSLTTTPGHEVWSENGWVAASALESGDRVWSLEHGWLTVVGSQTVEEWTEVFTLEVTGDPTFFAGEAAILVHNGRWGPPCHNLDLKGLWHDRYGEQMVGGPLEARTFVPLGRRRILDHVETGPGGLVGYEFSLARWHRVRMGSRVYEHKLHQLGGDIHLLRSGRLSEMIWMGHFPLEGSAAATGFRTMMMESGVPIRYQQVPWSGLPGALRRW